MRIFQLAWPHPQEGPDFAMAGLIGTWTEGPLCRTCKRGHELVPPFVLQWDPGSDLIGDFTWASGMPVVKEHVLRELEADMRGFRADPLEMVQPSKLKKPSRPNKRTKKRVWLPYEGPPLYVLSPTAWGHMDAQRSTARIVDHCDTCDHTRYELSGIEKREHRVEVVPGPTHKFRELHTHVAREPGKGLYVSAAELGDADFFGVHERSHWTFCTERMRLFIEARGYTNVVALEMGDIV